MKIPRDSQNWVYAPLKEIFNIESGTTPNTKKNIFWDDGDIDWYTPADIANRIYDFKLIQSKRKITKAGLQNKGQATIPKSSILISIRAPVGNIGIVNNTAAFNQGCRGLVPKSNEINTIFYANYLCASKKKLESLSGKTTFQELSKHFLESFEVPVPSISEQNQIASILSTVDDALIVNERERRAVERLKVGLVKKLLERKEWPIITLGDYLTVTPGFAFSSKKFNTKGKGLPLIRIRDLGKIETECYYEGPYDDSYIVEKGDLLIGMDGEFDAYIWDGEKALLNQRVCRIEPSKIELNKDYLYYVIRKQLKKREAQIGQTTVKHLSTKDFFKMKSPLPPMIEQKRIAEILSTLDKKLSLQSAQKQKLERIKKGMMNDLLTGRKRVKLPL